MRTRRWQQINGGFYGYFWSVDERFKFIAYNEGGGNGPLVYNLKLWRGWFPVGFYLAFNIRGRWFRASKGFTI